MAAPGRIRRYLPPRPFAKAHWSLLVGLLLLWPLSMQSFAGSKSFALVQIAILTAILFIALWHADLRRDVLQNWPRIARVAVLAIYDLFVYLVLAILILIPLTITSHNETFTERARVSMAMLEVAQQRTTVTDRAGEARSVVGSGKGLSVPQTKYISGGFVSPDGLILIVTENPPAVVVLRPRIEGGKVKWTCSGLPKKSVPGSCREPMVWE